MKFKMPTARIFRLLGIILTALLLLSGCARYDVGIRFADANHGEITQHIQFDQELSGLSGAVLNSWLETLEQQAIQLGGRVRHPSPQELLIKVPFYNAKDLQRKFNQMLYAQTRSTQNYSSIGSQLRMTTGNWIVSQHHHLQYDLDLRGLEIPAINSADSAAPLQLELSLKTPWGAKATDTAFTSMPHKRGRQLVWRLKPGKINHLDATFWVPSPLGIGTVIIVLLVLGGSLVKARRTEMGSGSNHSIS